MLLAFSYALCKSWCSVCLKTVWILVPVCPGQCYERPLTLGCTMLPCSHAYRKGRQNGHWKLRGKWVIPELLKLHLSLTSVVKCYKANKPRNTIYIQMFISKEHFCFKEKYVQARKGEWFDVKTFFGWRDSEMHKKSLDHPHNNFLNAI